MGSHRPGMREHVFLTYTNLRFGLGLLALAFPLVLLFGGMASGHPVQGSFCCYYHTPMRNIFVGVLFAIGSFLYLYKWFSGQENIALNVTGLAAILIALVPMDAQGDEPQARSTAHKIHNALSVLFLFSIAFVCIFRASDTLDLVRSSARYRFYSLTYKFLGVCMIVAPVAAFFLARRFQGHLTPQKQWIIFAV